MNDTEPDESWRTRAACRGWPVELWFPTGQPGRRPTRHLVTVDELQQAAALELCRTCPVRDECLDYAIHFDELGIWGGTTDRERRRIRRERAKAGNPIGTRPEAALMPRSNGQGVAVYTATCGTDAAYKRHLRRGETPCVYCRNANARAASLRRDTAEVR